jgi:type III restriction enzyme
MRRDEMNDSEVEAKAAAAAKWCGHATFHEQKSGGKPWRYILIPDDEITSLASLQRLRQAFQRDLASEVEPA